MGRSPREIIFEGGSPLLDDPFAFPWYLVTTLSVLSCLQVHLVNERRLLVSLRHNMKGGRSLSSIVAFTTTLVNLRHNVAAALSAPTMADLVPLEALAASANAYASASGIQIERKRPDDPTSTFFECAPMSLLPNAYPKEAFAKAQSVATDFNELVDRVSRDADFLERTLGPVAETDPFTGNILKLYKQVYVDGPKDSPANLADRLGIHRSDYMLHAQSQGEPYQLKQVELNTIAASFAGLSSRIFSLHRYLTTRFREEVKEFLEINRKIVSSSTNDPAQGVPENPTMERIPLAISAAYDRYVQRFTRDGDASNIIVLFVVQEGETNTVDQRMLEFRLFEDHNIPVVRMSLTKAHSEIKLAKDGSLTLAGKEIAIVYYRAGYAPADYPGGDEGIEWQARLKLENSRAAKCPSLGYHLAGTKKVQQELARPGILERFFSAADDEGRVEKMRSCFAGLYSMGDDATAEDLGAAREVLEGKQANYVLKPQREGGGYNFYGDKMQSKIRENSSIGSDGSLKLESKLAEFILMERLFPPHQRAILLRGGKVEGTGESVSELGCYATIVTDAEGLVVQNESAGFLLRSKFSHIDEGGVASGYSCLSSPYLC